MCVWGCSDGEADDKELLALEGGDEGWVVVVVDFDAGYPLGKRGGAAEADEGCNGVAVGGEEGGGDGFADVATRLRVWRYVSEAVGQGVVLCSGSILPKKKKGANQRSVEPAAKPLK